MVDLIKKCQKSSNINIYGDLSKYGTGTCITIPNFIYPYISFKNFYGIIAQSISFLKALLKTFPEACKNPSPSTWIFCIITRYLT